MQIVRGGKVSRLHDLVIRGKTFAIVQQFETPYNNKEKFVGKLLRLEANLQKPRKFSTVNDLHYTVCNIYNDHLIHNRSTQLQYTCQHRYHTQCKCYCTGVSFHEFKILIHKANEAHMTTLMSKMMLKIERSSQLSNHVYKNQGYHDDVADHIYTRDTVISYGS